MMKNLFILIVACNFIFSQAIENNSVVEEKSVFWKKNQDKLILNDGELFYGEYIEMKNKNVLFKIEFNENPTSFISSEIRHLVLSNGKIIIRNNKDHSLVCTFIWLFVSIYFYSLNIRKVILK